MSLPDWIAIPSWRPDVFRCSVFNPDMGTHPRGQFFCLVRLGERGPERKSYNVTAGGTLRVDVERDVEFEVPDDSSLQVTSARVGPVGARRECMKHPMSIHHFAPVVRSTRGSRL